MLHLGRVFEASILDRLWDMDLLIEGSEEREIVVGFDERFRGHIDCEVIHRAAAERSPECIDVKCVSQFELQKRQSERRARDKDCAQMQMYVHQGGYELGHILYISRESGQLYVHEVRPNRRLIDGLNAKARRAPRRRHNPEGGPIKRRGRLPNDNLDGVLLCFMAITVRPALARRLLPLEH